MIHFGLLCSIVYTFLNNVLKKISLFILEFWYWSLNQTCSLHLFTNHLFTSVYKPPLYICLQTPSLHLFTNHTCSYLFTNTLLTSVYKPPVHICLQTTSLHLFTNNLFTSVYKPPLHICSQTTVLFTNYLFRSV